jgi:ADP-ribosylglycohydrolase
LNLNDVLIGLAIGDAYGAGVEFQDRDWIRKHVDFTQFVNRRSSIAVPASKLEDFTLNYNVWDYTDDTEMTIGVIKALLSDKEFSEALLIEKWKEEYDFGIELKGYGRNGHGSMAWLYSGKQTIAQIREFQKNRPNPGNAPAMRSLPLGLINEKHINHYAAINANATHPNVQAVISSQCIARATFYMLVKKGKTDDLIKYCMETVNINESYFAYLNAIDILPVYEELSDNDFEILCGKQPLEPPYFLAGIKGMPSDSMYTAGCVLYVLKYSKDAMDGLKKSIYMGGDVDSIASIVTGILAGVHGIGSLPSFMVESVEGHDYLTSIAKDFEIYCNF